MELIGLNGWAKSGKNTAAQVLTKEFEFKETAFADKVREFLYVLNPKIDIEAYEILVAHSEVPVRFAHHDTRLNHIIDSVGWDGYKDTEYENEIRRLLQRLGTDCGRNLISDNVWVNATFKNLTGLESVVITDVRFPNEAQAIIDFGGEIWRIEREGNTPANNHISEISLDNWKWDRVVLNSGDPEEYKHEVRKAYKSSVESRQIH